MGADLLGVAGGDGTQALVAGIAAEHGIPLLVISAGTRNHGSRPARRDPRARMVRMPGSTSFPSGHSASAFAFATAVGDELPLAWLPLHTVAAAITSSRVHTGVHHPGDVLVGSLMGTAVAVRYTGHALTRRKARHQRPSSAAFSSKTS